jgi:hypothetical protein
MTVGVHPIPVPSAIFVKALTTLVFPELGGPTTIILGPLSIPSSFPTPFRCRLASNLVRSRARCIDVNWGCVVDEDEYWEFGKVDTGSQLCSYGGSRTVYLRVERVKVHRLMISDYDKGDTTYHGGFLPS